MRTVSSPLPRTGFRDYVGGFALLLALFGYALYALVTPASAEDGSGATVIFRTGLLAVFALAFMISPRRKDFRIGPLWPMYIFLALYALRLVDNFYLQDYVWNAVPSVTFGLLLGAALAPALLLTPLLPLRSFRAFALPMGLGCLILIAGIANNLDAIRSPDAFFGRLGTEKLNPISIASVATSFALFLLLWRGGPWWSKLVRYALVAGFLAVALLTKSRGPVLGTAAALLLMFVLADNATRRSLYQFLLVGIAAAFIGGMGMISGFISTGFERFQLSDQTMDDSAYGRVESWTASWAQFLESPVVGDRVFEPVLMNYPHNLFLESLISLGVLGTFILFLHIGILCRAVFWILGRRSPQAAEVFIAVIAIKELVQAQFSGSIWTNAALWVASASTIAIWSTSARAPVGARKQQQVLRADPGFSETQGGVR